MPLFVILSVACWVPACHERAIASSCPACQQIATAR